MLRLTEMPKWTGRSLISAARVCSTTLLLGVFFSSCSRCYKVARKLPGIDYPTGFFARYRFVTVKGFFRRLTSRWGLFVTSWLGRVGFVVVCTHVGAWPLSGWWWSVPRWWLGIGRYPSFWGFQSSLKVESELWLAACRLQAGGCCETCNNGPSYCSSRGSAKVAKETAFTSVLSAVVGRDYCFLLCFLHFLEGTIAKDNSSVT